MTAGAAARRRQELDELCAAVVRALAADPALHLREGRLYRGDRPCPAAAAPHLRADLDADGVGSVRGAGDGLALRRRNSDPDLHRRLRPDGVVAGTVFDMLEQFRVESLVSDTLPGVAANVGHRFRDWTAAFRRSGLTETDDGLLLYTLACICRARVTGQPVDEASEEIIEATRFALAPLIGGELEALRRHRHSQAGYAAPARSIAQRAGAAIATGAAARGGSATARRVFALLDPDTGDDEVRPAPAGDARTAGLVAAGASQYRVFTRAHDVEQDAAVAVARPARLRELRARLDRLAAEQRVNVGRLAQQLRAVFAEPEPAGWQGGDEEGLVDGRQLARLVTSPGERRIFRRPRAEPATDAVVSLLVDCSGSMRRAHEALATRLDLLLRALDLAGISCELLGFTTGAWHGGRALRDWVRAGRPPRPGRVNECRHLVFKGAGSTWREARPGIAALLREDIYREGIDGEAVLWALARLRGRPERRKVLVVVGDGSPMDGATHLVNDPGYLDRHLGAVLEQAAAAGDVRILGLGVGRDVSRFYARCVTLELSAQACGADLRSVVELLAGRHRR